MPSPGSSSGIPSAIPSPSSGPPGGGGTSSGGGDKRPKGDQPQGDQGESGNDGWESSNETPGSSGTSPGDGPQRPESDDSRGDSELDRALEVFDGQILSEREAILARRNETAGQRPLPEPTKSESEDGDGGGGGSVGGSNPAPPPKPPAKLPVPPDVADAQDDDVVCRQIREAAIAEIDTDLREALWEEYRRCGGRR